MDRRQLLQAGAAAAFSAAVSVPVATGMAAGAAPAPVSGGVFFFDARHPRSQRLAARVQDQGATVIAVDGDAAVRALPAGTPVLAGRTTYADFTWLSDLGRAHGMRLRFHAYQTFGAGMAGGSAERHVLSGSDALVAGDRWLQALLPPSGELQGAAEAERAGCTLHDWLFQCV